jgi:hypothetical protein
MTLAGAGSTPSKVMREIRVRECERESFHLLAPTTALVDRGYARRDDENIEGTFGQWNVDAVGPRHFFSPPARPHSI